MEHKLLGVLGPIRLVKCPPAQCQVILLAFSHEKLKVLSGGRHLILYFRLPYSSHATSYHIPCFLLRKVYCCLPAGDSLTKVIGSHVSLGHASNFTKCYSI